MSKVCMIHGIGISPVTAKYAGSDIGGGEKNLIRSPQHVT